MPIDIYYYHFLMNIINSLFMFVEQKITILCPICGVKFTPDSANICPACTLSSLDN
jgi:hypothetical protein